MTENHALSVKLETRIDLYRFSLSQTRDELARVRLTKAIEDATRQLDLLSVK